ncbi:MFS transporter [Histoplasma capsulatum var. duboisii H88]|uniref:MFS transporter n=2 Tax=Ajellomyces capsulatus (strain H88) TaxID=544711 RepID=F0U4L0_AJEC8|nr:MFS transporter [Histoplasma capsulatum var. duboisii H88]
MEANPATHADLIPGTIHLVDIAGETQLEQHDESQRDIVLVPRPSADPEDPLNWSRKRKLLQIAMVYVYTLGVGIPTTLQYSVLADITNDTGISTGELVTGTGLMFLFLGWACLIWQPIALTFGRRGVYILSCLLCVPIMVWTAYSKTGGEWYAHRILLGAFASPIESLPEISVPDIFFAHERGQWMATYVLFLCGSNFIAPLIAGWFNDAFGWRWTMHLGAMISAAAAVILFFGMEESLYFRPTVEGQELDAATVSQSEHPTVTQVSDEKAGAESNISANNSIMQSASSFPPPRTYIQKLALFVSKPGRPSNKEMFKMMYRPLLIMLHFPCTDWSGFLYGISLSWYNVMNGTASPVLSAAPYNWSAAKVGSAYVAPIIGGIFSMIWSGVIADKFAIYLARRNKGVREPEQRLWPLALTALITTGGLITWGVGAAYGVHWICLMFGMGMMAFGFMTGGSFAISYNVDCFKELSGETMVSVTIIRNTLGFAFSYGITPWVETQGMRNCFITASMVALVCTLTFLPMIYFGKRLRKFSKDMYWQYVSTSAFGGH